jgi:hypothetical protein
MRATFCRLCWGSASERVCVGQVEVTVRKGFAWVENGRVETDQIPDLQAALVQAQEMLRRQQ